MLGASTAAAMAKDRDKEPDDTEDSAEKETETEAEAEKDKPPETDDAWYPGQYLSKAANYMASGARSASSTTSEAMSSAASTTAWAAGGVASGAAAVAAAAATTTKSAASYGYDNATWAAEGVASGAKTAAAKASDSLPAPAGASAPAAAPAAAAPELQELLAKLDHSKPAERKAAVEALAKLEPAELAKHAGAIKRVAEKDRQEEVRKAAEAVLAKLEKSWYAGKYLHEAGWHRAGDTVGAGGKAAAKAAKGGGVMLMEKLVRPVAMPFQLLGSGARVLTLDTMAMTLPTIAKSAEKDVKMIIDTVFRAWTDGSLDANDLIPDDQPIKRCYALELFLASPVPPKSAPLVKELRIDLSNVDRATPQEDDNGVVTKLALDCEADVFLDLTWPLQGRYRGKCGLPDVCAQLQRARVRGPLKVYWHTQTGVLRAAFIRKPKVELFELADGYLRLCCCGVSACLVAPVLQPIIELALGVLDANDTRPLSPKILVPFKAPVGIRVAVAFNSNEKSLASLGGATKSATKVLRSLTNPMIGGKFNPDQAIPRAVLKQARGLVILTQLAGGALVSGMVATGIVVRRLDSGAWSPPASLAALGGGIGLQLGARNTETVIVLFSESAVDQFIRGNVQVKLGVDIAVAVGPVGRDLDVGARIGELGVAPSFSYSHSSGLYMGVHQDIEVMRHRHAENADYYRIKDVTPADILDAKVPRPDDTSAKGLNDLLEELCS